MRGHWNLRRALAFEAPGESFFLRIYQFENFFFSKVSKSNCDPQRQRSTASTRLQIADSGINQPITFESTDLNAEVQI